MRILLKGFVGIYRIAVTVRLKLRTFLYLAGRADYFGNLPNLAARVMALANPGQILLEGFWGFGPELKRGPDDLASLLPQRPSRIAGEPDHEPIEVLQLGKFPIKVCTCCVLP